MLLVTLGGLGLTDLLREFESSEFTVILLGYIHPSVIERGSVLGYSGIVVCDILSMVRELYN